MEDIIYKFGIDAKLIIVQIINFVILAGLLSYFLYKPVLRILAERSDKIAQGIADAEAAGVAKSEADKEKQIIVAEAHKEAEAVSARAKEHADAKTSEIISDAEEKANAIARMAEVKSEEIKAKAHKDSEAEIAKLAVLAAEKVLRQKAS